MTILFSLAAFKIMSLSLTFESFKITCLEEDLSAFRQLDGLSFMDLYIQFLPQV